MREGLRDLLIIARSSWIRAVPDEVGVPYDGKPRTAKTVEGDSLDHLTRGLVNMVRHKRKQLLVISPKVIASTGWPAVPATEKDAKMYQEAQAPLVQQEFEQAMELLMTRGTKTREVVSTMVMDELDKAYTMHVRKAMKNVGDTGNEEWTRAMAAYRKRLMTTLPNLWERMDLGEEGQAALGYAPAKLKYLLQLREVGLVWNLPLPCHAFAEDLYLRLARCESAIKHVSFLFLFSSRQKTIETRNIADATESAASALFCASGPFYRGCERPRRIRGKTSKNDKRARIRRTPPHPR